MATGSAYIYVNNKRLLSFADLQTNLVDSLLEMNRQTTMAQWNLDGVFDAKLTLTGPGNDQVQVNGTNVSTDGSGHILRVDQSAVGAGDPLAFENALGITYYVGLRYALIPQGIQINPRTGLPEYKNRVEEIAESAAPSVVVDNTGTITFTIDSVCEAGVSHAGRTARIWKVIPGEGATTEAIAIEDVAVVYTAGNNKITTTGTLGQSAVSTTAADYMVALLGPSVKRNTDLEASSDHFFIGTVLGVGLGSPPTVFDTTNQRVFTAYTSAAIISLTPTGWITAVNVQDAFGQVVTVLASNAATPGAAQIGVYPDAFSRREVLNAPTTADSAGIGDETEIGASPTVQDTFLEVEKVLKARKGWSATLSPDTAIAADVAATTALETMKTQTLIGSSVGGSYFLNRGTYLLSTGGTQLDQNYYVHGEVASKSDETLYVNVQMVAGQTTRYVHGEWSRVFFISASTETGSATSGQFVFGGLIGVGTDGGFHLDQVGIASGHAQISTGNMLPWSLRNAVIRDQSGTTATPGGATQRDGLRIIGGGATKGYPHGIIENVLIEGPPADAATQGHTLFMTSMGGVAFADENNNALTVRNCVFRGINPGTNVLRLTNTTLSNLVFENCVFVAADDNTEPVIYVSASQVTFKDCLIVVKGGDGVYMTDGVFKMERCKIVDLGTAPQVQSPQLLAVQPGAGGRFDVDDLWIFANDGAFSPTAQEQVISIGQVPAGTPRGNCDIKNLKVEVGSPSDLGANSLLTIISSETVDEQTNVRGLVVDLNYASKLANGLSAIATDSTIELVGGDAYNLSVEQFQVLRGATNSGDNTGNGSAFMYCRWVTGGDWRIDLASSTVLSPDPKTDYLVHVDSCQLNKVLLKNGTNSAGIQNSAVYVEGADTLLSEWNTELRISTTYGDNNACICRLTGDKNVVKGGRWTRASTYGYGFLVTGDNCKILGITFEPTDLGTERFVDGSGANAMVCNNTFMNNRAVAQEISLTGDGSMVCNNIFSKANEVIGNVVINSGTNSVTANNIVQN